MYTLVHVQYYTTVNTRECQNMFIAPRRNPVFIKQALPVALGPATPRSFLRPSSRAPDGPCAHCHAAAALSVSLLPLSIRLSRLIHVAAASGRPSFLRPDISHCVAVPRSVPPSDRCRTVGHLSGGCESCCCERRPVHLCWSICVEFRGEAWFGGRRLTWQLPLIQGNL